MPNDFIEIKDLPIISNLSDNNRILIDDTAGTADTYTVYLSILRDFLTKNIKPSIDATTGNWFIGNVDTGFSAKQIDFDNFLDSSTVLKNEDASQNKMAFDVQISTVSDNLLEKKMDGLYVKIPEVNIEEAEINSIIDVLWPIATT